MKPLLPPIFPVRPLAAALLSWLALMPAASVAAPTITGLGLTPAAPTNSDSPVITATVTPSSGTTISNVKLTYSTGSVSTGTVFSDTMATIPLGSPWSGAGALNPWTVTLAGAPAGGAISQAGGTGNHTVPVTLTGCSTAGGSATVSCATTASLWPGMLIAGANIPTGATVSSISSPTSFVLSGNATASGTALTLSADGISLTGCATASGSASVTCASTAGLVGATTVVLTGSSTVSGSATVTCASTAGLVQGMSLSGTDIPNGSVVSSVTSSTQFISSGPASGTGSALTLTATFSGMPIVGLGIPTGATVSSVASATQFVLSANATATATGLTLTAPGCGLQLSKGDGTYTDTMATTTNAIPAAATSGTLQFYAETQNFVANNGWTMQLSPSGGTQNDWTTRAGEACAAETVALPGCTLTAGSATVTCASTAGLAAGMAMVNPSLSLTGCSTASGSTTVTCASTAGLLPGMSIASSGLAAGTTVASITSTTQFVVSSAATATASSLTMIAIGSQTLTACATTSGSTAVTCASTAGLLAGMSIAGSNIPGNTTVASVAGSTQIVLSAAATATATAQIFTASYLPANVTISSVTSSTQFVLSANSAVTGSSLNLAATTANHGFQLYSYTLQPGELVNTLKMRFQFSGYNPAAPAKPPQVDIDDISMVTTVGVPPVTVAMSSQGNGVYSGQIAPEASGATVTYTITATDSAGNSTTGSGTPYTVRTAAPVLSITPSTGFTPAGVVGGSITPASAAYTLTNTGAGAMGWSTGNTQSWLTVSPTTGTLAAGASVVVTASINSNAQNLAAGTYNDTVTFANTSDGVGNTTAPVTLSLYSLPAAPVIPAVAAFAEGTSNTISWAAVTGAASYTLEISATSNFSSPLAVQTVTVPSGSFTNLTSGATYYYRVLANNPAGTSPASNVVAVTQDATPPTVAITGPVSGASTATASITVTGTGSDAISGIAGVTVNWVPATSTNGFATWTATIPLGFGTNNIFAVATDVAGNTTTTAPITVTLTTATTYNPLYIPPTLKGTTFNLSLNQTSKQFYSGPTTATYAFNNERFWGPTLILNQGDTVQMNVTNNLSETTTVHWHGFHIPAIMDGGPHEVIPVGTTWSPSFTVLNNAATYWYHPHLAGDVQQQLTMGAGGLIIVKDPIEAALNLPRTYGTDDIPIVLTSRRWILTTTNLNQFVTNCDYGDYMLVNGTLNPQLTVPAQWVRLRVLNGETARAHTLGFSDGRTFYVIATDGGLVNAPIPVTQVRMDMGERLELLVNFTGQTGTNLNLVSYNNQPPGYPGAEAATSGAIGSLLNDITFNDMNINVVAPTANPVTTIPTTLANNVYWKTSDVTNSRSLQITYGYVGASPAGSSGATFDNQIYSPSFINQTVNMNAIEAWSITNNDFTGHVFHIHDVQFYLISRSPNTAPGDVVEPWEVGWKDTIHLKVNTTSTFIARFGEFASNNNPFMYHCHIWSHEDGGLMNQFLVVNNAVEDLAVASFTRLGLNPAINLQFNSTPGTTYTLQYSPNLNTGSWTNIGYVTSDGYSANFTETDPTRLAQPQGFYQVAIPVITQ